jgi:hypothetical protein
MKFIPLLLVPFLFVACNSFTMKIPLQDGKEVVVKTGSFGRGAVKVDTDPQTKQTSIITCYDATTDWIGVKIIPMTFQGLVTAYRGMAPQALGGGAILPESSKVSGCDAIMKGGNSGS